MRHEQVRILQYLKSSPLAFFSVAEISRRVGDRKQYEENRRWAQPHLTRLVEEGLVECDVMGHYRFLKDGE